MEPNPFREQNPYESPVRAELVERPKQRRPGWDSNKRFLACLAAMAITFIANLYFLPAEIGIGILIPLAALAMYFYALTCFGR